MGQPYSSPASNGNSNTSTIISETISGSHILRIDGYSETKGHGVGNSINSSVFTVGGHSWYIACFPEGSREECAGWISLFLCLDHPAVNKDDEVDARFDLYLLNSNGKPVSAYLKKSRVTTFSLVDGFFPRQRWGYRRFIKRMTFEKLYLRDDSLQIKCDVTVVNETTVETTIVRPKSLVLPPPAVTPPDLDRHLGDLLASKVGVDVTFVVSGELFQAHKIIIAARSSVFMAELFGHMKEKHMTCVPIDDMDPSVFRAMLHFIYTDSLPEIDERDKTVMAQHLLVAADRYNLEKLKLICKDILLRCMDARTVATTLVLAEQHGCHALKKACFMFLESLGNRKVVFMASDGFQHLRSSCPSLLEEVLAKVAP